MGRPAGALKVKVLGCAVGQRAALHRVEAAGGNRRVGRLVADPERRINRGGGIADQFQVTRAGGRQVRREVGAKGCDRASAKDFHEIRAVFTRGVA